MFRREDPSRRRCHITERLISASSPSWSKPATSRPNASDGATGHRQPAALRPARLPDRRPPRGADV